MKNDIFCIFIKFIWLGVGFLNGTGTEICYREFVLKTQVLSILKDKKNTASAQLCLLVTSPGYFCEILGAPKWMNFVLRQNEAWDIRQDIVIVGERGLWAFSEKICPPPNYSPV